MKRLLFAVFLALFLVTPAGAQGPDIYLPAISKGDDCMAMAILEISDGTTTVSLLAGKQTGFHLEKWRPVIVQPKGGGVFQDSSIASGRELVFAVDGTANEVFNLKVNDDDQDELIRQTQDLLRLLLKARSHGLAMWQDEPVWIKARAACETNARYARVINFTIEELDNPYAPPFFSASQIATMDGITLGLERGHWLGNPPGVGACVEASGLQDWEYNNVWEMATNLPTFNVWAIFEAANGFLFATQGNNTLMRSVDGGATWANNLTGAPLGANDNVLSFVQLASGRILAGVDNTAVVGNGQIIFTDDNGASWAQLFTDASVDEIREIIELSDGTLLMAGQVVIGGTGYAAIWRSIDSGANWTLVFTGVSGQEMFTVAAGDDGVAVAGGLQVGVLGNGGEIYRSDDWGVTWQVTQVLNGTGGVAMPINQIRKLSDGNYYLIGFDWGDGGPYDGELWWSQDNGITWARKFGAEDITFNNFVETDAGTIYASGYDGTLTYIYRSLDYGFSFQRQAILTGELEYHRVGFLVDSNGSQFVSQLVVASRELWWNETPDALSLGRGATCGDEVYVINRYGIANLTHIKRDDGGAFTDLMPMAVFPVDLFPAAPALNDAIYFGIDSSVSDSGPFSSLVFDLATTFSVAAVTVTWEVWTGAAWVTLDVGGDGVQFARPGVRSVHWIPPSGWATTAVDGVTAWWVRARISTIIGSPAPPEQQGRAIYAVVLPYADIDAAQVPGDIPALARIRAHNRSDRDGPYYEAPDLYANRLLVGLRSDSRGDFWPIVNISDEQNPPGFGVTLGTNTTFAADVAAPTGRRAVYNPAGAEAMATRATVTLSPAAVRDYYGTFHAFLRVKRTAGVYTDFTVRLQIVGGSGGVISTTESRQVISAMAFELLDFGQVEPLAAGEVGDLAEIRIQASAGSGTPDLYLYDLILLPVDEWPGDFVDQALETGSDIGRSNSVDKLLDINSVTRPRRTIQALVRATGSDYVSAIYQAVTPGEAILQANADQRLCFLAAQGRLTGTHTGANNAATLSDSAVNFLIAGVTAGMVVYNTTDGSSATITAVTATTVTGTLAGGTDNDWDTGDAYLVLCPHWVAPPEISHSIQVYANSRYLGMRGNR